MAYSSITFFTTFTSSVEEKKAVNDPSSHIKITFKNKVGNSAIALRDSIYTNPFGERFSITKLRYYVTNVALSNAKNSFKEIDSYHLVDESKPESQSIFFSLPPGKL